MLGIIGYACCLWALSQSVRAAHVPVSDHHVFARRLLGSSFGLPGNQTFDYVVIGGGTAGLTIATRLAEDPSKRIAVVEAGNFYETLNGNLSEIPIFASSFSGKSRFDIAPFIDWGFITTPQASIHYARGKCLGGSSGRNYLTYHISTKSSYKNWADLVGDSDYDWDNFVPYFGKSIEFTPPDSQTRPANATPEYDTKNLGNGQGPLSVTFARYALSFSSWAQLALKTLGVTPIKGLTNGELLGSSYQLLTIDAISMTRESSETSFLRKNGLQRSNPIIFQSTLAKRILFDEKKTANGVEIDMNGLEFVLSATKEVIVSAGAFQSPQILMVSGVGPAATIQKHGIPLVADRPGVGKNMQDHILGGPSYRVNLITTSSLGNPLFAAKAAKEFNDKASGILTDSGSDFLAWEEIPDYLRSSFSPNVRADLAKLPSDWPEIEFFPTSAYYDYQQNYLFEAPKDGYNYATVAIGLQAPFSRGTVDIESADMSDHPIINPNWLTHPTDQAVAVAGFKRTRQLFQTEAMSPIIIGPEYFPRAGLSVETDAQILDFIRQSFSTVFHASCTCAMGRASDAYAVVDSKARVFGVKNLRVVDAAAFPLLPPGHPVATVYALAEKIADDIKKGS